MQEHILARRSISEHSIDLDEHVSSVSVSDSSQAEDKPVERSIRESQDLSELLGSSLSIVKPSDDECLLTDFVKVQRALQRLNEFSREIPSPGVSSSSETLPPSERDDRSRSR